MYLDSVNSMTFSFTAEVHVLEIKTDIAHEEKCSILIQSTLLIGY